MTIFVYYSTKNALNIYRLFLPKTIYKMYVILYNLLYVELKL